MIIFITIECARTESTRKPTLPLQSQNRLVCASTRITDTDALLRVTLLEHASKGPKTLFGCALIIIMDDSSFNVARGKQIVSLKGAENYKIWSIQLESILKARSVFKYVNGDKKKPNKDESEDKIDEWESKDAAARGLLICNVTDSIVLSIEYLTTSKEVWDHLQTTYAPSGIASEFARYQDWSSLDFDGKDLEKFCHLYKTKLLACLQGGIEIDKKVQVYQFILHVTPYFESFAANLRQRMREMKKDDLPTLESIIGNALDEQRAQSTQSARSANLARTQKSYGKQNNKGSGLGKPTCLHCGKLGHSKDDCFKLHPEKMEAFRKKREQEGKGKSKDTKKESILPERSFYASVDYYASEDTMKALTAAEQRSSWILDSGASVHMTNDLSAMSNCEAIDATVRFGKGETAHATVIGDVVLKISTDEGVAPTRFTGVIFVPGLVANLLSTELLRKKGLFYRNDKQILFTSNNETIAEVYVHNDLPHIRTAPSYESALASSKILYPQKATADLWHARLGHLPVKKLTTATVNSTGLVIEGSLKMKDCQSCRMASSQRVMSRVSSPRPEHPYSEVSLDVVTVKDVGIDKSRYFTLFTDAATLYRHVYHSSTKSGAAVHIRDHYEYVHTQLDTTVKAYHLDGGREFGGNELHKFARERGIMLKVTTPHNSESNGRAEVSNHIVCRMARKLLLHANLPTLLWPEAVRASVYILNRTPSDALGGKSPYQALAKKAGWPTTKPYVGNFKAYGCVAYVLDEDVTRGAKFDSRTKLGRLVGYETYNIFRIWLPSEHKIIRTTNVTFDETSFGSSTATEETGGLGASFDDFFTPSVSASRGEGVGEAQSSDREEQESDDGGVYESMPAGLLDEQLTPAELLDKQLDQGPIPEFGRQRQQQGGAPAPQAPQPAVFAPPVVDPEPRRSNRERQPSQKAREAAAASKAQSQRGNLAKLLPPRTLYALNAAITATAAEIPVPNTYKEAMASPQAHHWLEAMKAEIDSLVQHKVWKLVKKPDGSNVIKGRWVFTLKRGKDGSLDKYKARWVARGFTQIASLDYDDTYASVSKPISLKVLLALVAQYDLECKQYDIITAFLNSILTNHTIYVEQPHGFEIDELVCLLLKALYGLKQSPLLWYDELTKFLRSINFAPLYSDACVFKHASNGSFVIVYVDDLLIIAAKLRIVEAAARDLLSKFAMRELGDASFYLGCRIIRDRPNRKIFMVQDAFIERAAARFKVTNIDAVKTPLDPGVKSEAAPKGYKSGSNLLERYQSLVGSLIWPSTQTRPDIAYHVGQLSKHLRNPTEDHLAQAKHCLKYLHSTKTLGICFTGTANGCKLTIDGYTDASWGDNLDDRTSTGGMVFIINGGPVCWKSGKQPLVTLSSTEAEFVSLTLAAKEAAAVGRLLDELEYPHPIRPLVIYEDSQPAISLVKRPNCEGRTKHIDIRWCFIRQEVSNGSIKIEWIPTYQQAADGLTKNLGAVKFARFTEMIGMTDCQAAIAAELEG